MTFENYIVHTANVDFVSRIIPKPIHIVQGDNSESVIEISIYFNNILSSINDILEDAEETSLRLRCKDSKGNTFFVEFLHINEDGNKLYFPITDVLTMIPGYVTAVVEIVCDDKIAQSSKILIDVDRNPVPLEVE